MNALGAPGPTPRIVRLALWCALALASACGKVVDHTEEAVAGFQCYDCHGALYLGTTQPDHVALGFGKTCEGCHTTDAWRPATIENHDFWPLTGAHGAATCESCHPDGRFADTPSACVGCHRDDFTATTNPDHVAGGFAETCETCHTTAAWRPATFDHQTVWPLVGAHAAATCESCHPGGVYRDTPTSCDGCHHDDWAASDNPDHEALGLSTTCESCHGPTAWHPAEFAVHDRYWPLVGAHAAATCESCHPGGRFTGTPSACEGCHMADYQASTNPGHVALELPTACGACHTEAAWKPATFDAHDRFWPIEGKHRTATCVACHSDGRFADAPRECEGCHLADARATTDPDHVALELPTACGGCHTADGWSPAGFDAHDRFWPIAGKHVGVACEACHEGGVFHGTARACEGCHADDYAATTDPDHAALELSTACAGCHDEAGWAPAGFDAHDRFWPLTGAHVEARCESCHTGDTFAGTATACEGCHGADWDATDDPPHAAAGFPKTCETCHDSAAWSPTTFDHAAVWPIDGAHTTVACEGCHAGAVYEGTARACEGCHQDDYDATSDPDHAALGFSKACSGCHATSAWSPAGFASHDAFWPLVGEHAAASCESCHAGGVFAGTPKDCVACHRDDYDGTTAPAHAALGYPTDCARCHDAGGWTGATFDHGRYWPLAGAHQAASCVECHAGGVFAGTATACVGCHRADYDGTRTPDHGAAGFSTTCEGCHGASGWTPATFDHGAFWPLTGAHAAATCEGCHANEVYQGTPKTCQGCHLDDYQRSTRPAHAVNGYPKTCETCHATSGWAPSGFDHAAIWPLAGRHASASCAACHVGGVFAGTATTCEGCHLAEYQATTTPDHEAAGFPRACESCHSASAWTPSTFDHATFWPLTGRHASADCASCHAGGVYAGTPTSCNGCHMSEFRATTDPDHEVGGLSTNCAGCHSTSAWQPSTFRHSTVWPLTGRHASASCESCHVGGVYNGTPTACVGCHRDDYDATTAPDHAAAGFSNACESCHSSSAWVPSSFDHAAIWPLTGRHASASCESCHVGGVYNGTPTACVGCHRDDYDATTAPDHAAVGYPTDCAACHASTSAWTPATFDHSAFWPLTGAHTSAQCEDCHAGGVYSGTPTTCVGCHQSDYTSSDNPGHTRLGLSTTCTTCHSTTSWATTTFPVHNPIFPITTGKHRGFACSECHVTPQWAEFTCTGCHTGEHTIARMNNKHLGDVPNYQATLNQYGTEAGCYHCHPNGQSD